jgi:hypothetical protein
MHGRHHTDAQHFCHRTWRIIFKRIIQKYRASALAGPVQFRTEPVARSCGSSNVTSRFIKFREFNYVNNYRLLKKDSATQSSFSYVEKGMQYNLHHKPRDWIRNLVWEAEAAVIQLPDRDQDYVRHRITEWITWNYVVSWLVIHYTVTTGSPSNLGFNHTKLNSGPANLPSEVFIYCSSKTWNLEGHDSTDIPESDGGRYLTTL